jgi:hypothetical protein
MSLNSSWPRTEALNIDDQSIPLPIAEDRLTPKHLPLFFIRAATGPIDEIVPISTFDSAKRIFHADSFDFRGEYFNHQTALMMRVLSTGNACFVKRIVSAIPASGPNPAYAPKYSEFVLGVSVKPAPTGTPVYPWVYNPDGTVTRATTGAITGTMIVKPIVIPTGCYTDTVLRSPIVVAGPDNEVIYPILKLRSNFVGKKANNIGVRVWPANVDSIDPTDLDIVDHQSAVTYNLQFVERIDRNVVAVIQDLSGDGKAEFGLKRGMFNYKTDQTLSLKSAVAQWSDHSSDNSKIPVYGPAGEAIAFTNNIITLTKLLKDIEDALLADTPTMDTPIVPNDGKNWLIDFLSGVSYEGFPYQGFSVDKSQVNLTRNNTFYLTGGFDGDNSDTAYDDTVALQYTLAEVPEMPLTDSAKYPFTDIYDSGFSVPTKEALMNWTDIRNDVYVTIGTAVAGAAKLSATAEVNTGLSLVVSALLHVESTFWGTPTCRVLIVGQSGVPITGEYDERVPMTFEIAVKRARYMGAGNGVFKTEFKYDEYPGNQVDTLKDISLPNITNSTKKKLWDGGINYCQTYDERKMFYAGLHTVYPEQQSVLTGDCYVHICCDIKRQSEKVWKMLTGISTLSDEQFIAKSDALLTKFTEGNYDDRVRIRPKTFFTAADKVNGSSWVQTATVYGRVAKTVNQVTIVSKRLGV